MVNFKRTMGADPDFQILAAKLTAFLAELNGENDAFYAPLNSSETIPTVVVAMIDGTPAACGAFRQVDEETVEIKRMFVDPEQRGTGLGKAILDALESWAKELGAVKAVLETSRRLPPAVNLYTRNGYEPIPNYGPYVGVEDSVCMQKRL